MSRIIAGIYEIEQEIGAGGGGIVYLGRHTRLNKKVVLKADKRTLATGTDALRREVDLLKNLSHTYIPQVYDFVQENGVVYTVMDYIEGESLDKLLGRGQVPSQPDFVKWSCQLLEALCYLHSREPHGILHGDIKPANIMLRPNGDICLIDFNIALALGEDGAVKVGFSRGYASPEHYGADYFLADKGAPIQNSIEKEAKRKFEGDETEADDATQADEDVTEVDEDATVVESTNKNFDFAGELSSRRSTTSMKNAVLLDARSDIYSLGATLYHVISGTRPAQDARMVIPLGKEVCSPAISAIIQKAMSPQPADRYQTAEEMLDAFLCLYKTDERTIQHKRRAKVTAAAIGVLFLTGGACAFVGLKQMEQRQNALALAEYSANALNEGNVTEAVHLAMQAIPANKSILNAPIAPQAQKALTDALGVYDLSDGFHALDVLALPSEPFDVAVSPNGKRLAVVYAYEMSIYDAESQNVLVTLPTVRSARADIIFVDDSKIIFAGEDGVTLYDIDANQAIWTGNVATTLAVSADKSVVAAVNRDADSAAIYSVADGNKIADCKLELGHLDVPVNDIFADAENDIFALNSDGSYLAASSYTGGLALYNIANPQDSLIVYESSDYTHFEGGFSGNIFAFSAQMSGESELGIIDVKEGACLGGFTSDTPIMTRADENGIYLAKGGLLEQLDPDTLEEKQIVYIDSANIAGFAVDDKYELIATDDAAFSFYNRAGQLLLKESESENSNFLTISNGYACVGNRSRPSLRLLKEEGHEDAKIAAYDAAYSHDEARISKDQQTIMLFDYQSFRIVNNSNVIISEVELPDAEHIYDQQFRKAEPSYLEVIWYDGTVRCYSAADGKLISEEKKDAPDTDLYEEFYTSKYRIASSLHQAPEVYDITTNKLVAALEADSYLTYVTEAGDNLITEYVDAEGNRFGLLLDENFETLAYLPYLCDVSDDTLIFDYHSGDLRQSRLYSIQELISLGEVY